MLLSISAAGAEHISYFLLRWLCFMTMASKSLQHTWRYVCVLTNRKHQNAVKVSPFAQHSLRSVWSEAPPAETLPGERFYDSTIEKVQRPARWPVSENLSLASIKDVRLNPLHCCSMPFRTSRRFRSSRCWSSADLRSLTSQRSSRAQDMRKGRYVVAILDQDSLLLAVAKTPAKGSSHEGTR